MSGKNEESLKALEKAKQYTSDLFLYTTLGDAYKGAKQYVKAKSAYQHAAYMEPNKIYPDYLLVELFVEYHLYDLAINKANHILQCEDKAYSIAAEEIRLRTKKIYKECLSKRTK